MRKVSWGMVSLLLLGTLAGCGDTTPDALRVEVPLDEGAVGALFQLEATVRTHDGRRVAVAEDIAWTVSDPSVGTLLPGSLLKLKAPGTLTVTAQHRDARASAVVTVRAAAMSALTLTPDVDALQVGDEQRFAVLARFGGAAARDVTAQATWRFEGSLAPAGGPGHASAVRAGRGQVHVAFEGQSIDADVVVLSATREAMTLDAPLAMRAGDRARVTLTAKAADGSARDVSASAMWTSSNLQAAELVLDGSAVFVRGVGPGVALLSAVSNGVQTSVPLFVGEQAIVALEADLERVALPVGASHALTVSARYADGARAQVVPTFEVAHPSVIAVDAAGMVTAVGEGTSHVRLVFGGVAAAVEVVVSPARLSGLSVSLPQLRLARGQLATLQVLGRFTDGTTVDLSQKAVTVGTPVHVGVHAGPEVMVEGRALGSERVLVAAAGFEVEVQVEVTDVPVDALRLRLERDGAGARVVAVARWADGVEGDVTELVAWTLKGAAPAAISASAGTRGRLTLPVAGEALVVATLAGHTVVLPIGP